ncbi:hypothetical protein OHS33_01380 [Streptomyces sp. NBC_00536]|uniref:hypothetical protein n=1 Tax=Streptomyces sp. NBC_00536 TaxID=2975769 RepID=UPI002E80898F|nr:hypothetical protein [Streptomyces sp. NBC_00536]WUC77115.1 hypothetical protein OHS33_01380 [Streptomyces sp. NBC_00536]
MNRLALLVAGTAVLAVSTITPAGAAALPTGSTETVTSCGYSGLQAGLNTRVCAEVTGTTVEFYGTVGLAGPPSPGGPWPDPKELITTLSTEVVGGVALSTRTSQVIFTASTLQLRGPASTVPCGSTVRATFAAASYPRPAQPVVHEVTIAC